MMMQAEESGSERQFLARAVAILAGEEHAKEALPAIEEAFALARRDSRLDDPEGSGDGSTVRSRVTLSVPGSDGGRPASVGAVFSERTPIDSGPKKRTPIRVGGGSCWTVKIGPLTITVCVDWEREV